MAKTLKELRDEKGLPFVGPAGRLLDRALEAAGVNREHFYVTNAVKHKTPAQREIDACQQWLEGEIKTVKPSRARTRLTSTRP